MHKMAAALWLRAFVEISPRCRGLAGRRRRKELWLCGLQASLHCCPTAMQAESITDVSKAKPNPIQKSEKISKAMKAYIERAKAHDAMMEDEIMQYEMGKRHLANIMGEDPDSFTQTDINKALEYLLPSGLFEKKARPFLMHPHEIFPKKKAAQFGMDGRPFHFLFYTGKPNYYQLMHDAMCKLASLKEEEGKLLNMGIIPADRHPPLNLYGSQWINQLVLKDGLLENINEHDYHRFVLLMENLKSHPLGFREETFIMNYRRSFTTQSMAMNFPEPMAGEDGRQYAVGEGKRKTATAKVTVWINGTGQFTVNGQDLLYFTRLLDRQQVMFPLQFLNKLGQVDVKADVKGGGPMGKAGAVRLALSQALASFVDSDTVEKMRLAGLLTRDPRRREREKIGLRKARARFIWKKR